MEKANTELNEKTLLPFLLSELATICGMTVEADTSLLKTGRLDSIGLVQLITAVQAKFGVDVNLNGLKRKTFDTPKLMLAYLTEHPANG